MKPEKPKNLGFKQIYFNLDKILFLFFLTFMMIEFVWLPSNSWIAGLLLRQTGYLFLSYNNIFAIIKGSPFISLCFIILVIVNFINRLLPDRTSLYRSPAPSSIMKRELC